ncbi:hypothetical protein NIES2104_50170 [Leptolyngbya sp. NIES-2104]|nr:hypothetical protein NIES2104_50170 [Leptolyngbya sp. NIES-2104]
MSDSLPPLEQTDLHTLLSQSPLSELDFECLSVQSPVRDVELSVDCSKQASFPNQEN